MATALASTLCRASSAGIFSLLLSLCEVHNESVNVWSHLLGALGYFAMIFIVLYAIGPLFLPLIYDKIGEGIGRLLQEGNSIEKNPLLIQ